MSDQQFYLMCASSAVVAIAAIPLWLSFHQQRQQKQKRIGSSSNDKLARRGLSRQWSFTSQGMCLGIFPDHVQAPDTIINVALYFDNRDGGVPSVEDLVELVIKPLLKYERFSSVPPFQKDGVSSRTKRKSPIFKPRDLIRNIELQDGGEVALHQAMMFEEKLDVGRNDLPWFEIVRIDNKSTTKKSKPKGRSACLLRFHHCLGDGLSLLAVFDKIITNEDGKPVESKVAKAIMSRKPPRPSLSSILSSLFHVLGLASSPFDDDTVFFKRHPKLKYSGTRQVTLFPTVPLDFIKEIRAKCPFSTTVNDIIMCAVSQAIRDYCEAEQDPVLKQKSRALQCRALLPVSLPRSRRDLSDPKRVLSNQFSMLSADLAVGSENVQDRLRTIHKTTDFLKTSPRAFLQLWLQNNLVSRLPTFVGRQTALDVFSRHSLVLTNVPGPSDPVLLAKKKVAGLQLFFPNVIPQVDMISYAGQVYGNIIFDPVDLPKGATMAALYAKALVKLGQEFQVKNIPKVLVDAQV